MPFLNAAGFSLPGGGIWALPHGVVVVLEVMSFAVKVFFLGCFQILIRWTLPRFRYDQLMALGWKFLLPLAAANLVVTAIVRWATL